MKQTIWLLLLVFPALCVADTVKVYKTRDSEGNVVFSDSPTKNAETIELQPVQTFSPDNIPDRARATGPKEDLPAGGVENVPYESVTIVQPKDGETIWSSPGDISVAVSVKPKLQRGDTLEIYVNGKKAGESSTATMIQLTGLLRDQHTITAQIVNEDGTVVASSAPVLIYLHKASVR